MQFFNWLRDWKRTAKTYHRPARRPASRFAPTLEELERRDVPSAVLFDLNPGPADGLTFSAFHPADVNGMLYFAAHDNGFGFDQEIWESDGTAAGTAKLKDIWPGSRGSFPSWFTNLGGSVLFSADDGVHGRELWQTDGTPAGTKLFKDINPGFSTSDPSNLININGTLFFTANDGVHGVELWKSDGTPEGTMLLKDLNPGDAFTPSFPGSLTNVNGTLYFNVLWDAGGRANSLWKSDGTPEGTVLVKDIYPGPYVLPNHLTNFNGTLFFTAFDGIHGIELWKSNGTSDGTVMVKDIYAGGAESSSHPEELTVVNGTLFFTALDPVHGRELWKSDGTPEGTVLVKEFIPGWDGNGGVAGPNNLSGVGNTLFFVAPPLSFLPGNLWQSDGTPEGTVLLNDFASAVFGSSPSGLTPVGNRLFFAAETGAAGRELWTSDGTAQGTFMVQDLAPAVYAYPLSSNPAYLTASNGSLYFTANDGFHGVELWRLSQWARDDAARTTVNTAVTIVVTGNDFLSAGAGSAITALTGPDHGSAILNADGAITYTPSADFSGVDSFTYTVTNRFGDIDTAMVTIRVILPVQIDIKPGSTTNAINLNNDGEIVVNLFSGANFDATTIDISTVLFAGAGVKSYEFQDVNRDGRLDLVLHFRIDDTNLREVYSQLLLADADDGMLDTTREQTTLLLTGSTTDGKLWEGLDSATLFESGQTLKDLLIALGLK